MLGTGRERVEARPLWHVRKARREVRRRGAAQGPAHPDRPSRRPGPGHHDRDAVAGHGRRGRRTRRADRGAARRRARRLRRRLGGLVAARRRGDTRRPGRPADGRGCGEGHPGRGARSHSPRRDGRIGAHEHVRPRAEIVVDLAAIRHNVRLLRDDDRRAGDRDRQGRRLRPRHGRVGPRGPRCRGRVDRRRHPRRGRGAPTGRRPGPPALLADRPGRVLRRGGRAGRRRDGVLRHRAGRDRRGGRGRGPRGAGADQGGHRALARRRAGGAVERRVRAGLGRASWRAAGRSPASGRTSRAATSPTTRPTTSRRRAFRVALAAAEQAGLQPEVRHLGNSAAALLRPSSRFDAVRCGIAIYGLDPAPGPDPRPRPGAGDDRPSPAGDGEARRGRRLGLLRPHLDRRAPDEHRPGPGRVRRRRTPAREQRRRRSRSAASAGRSAAGCAWTSSWWTSTATCRRRAPRSCCSGPCGRAPHRAGLGGGVGHDQLRDRQPDRRTDDPQVRRRGGPHEHPQLGPRHRRRGRRAWAWPAPPRACSASERAISRRAGAVIPFGSLRSEPITVVADDGVNLHVEIDEVRPPGRTPKRRWAAPRPT